MIQCEALMHTSGPIGSKQRCPGEVRFSVATGKSGHGKRRGLCWIHYCTHKDNPKKLSWVKT